MIVQIVLCAALLLGCLGLLRFQPGAARGMAELFDGLLTADRVEIPSGTGVAAVSARAREAAVTPRTPPARVLTELLTPPAAQPPSPDASGDGDAGRKRRREHRRRFLRVPSAPAEG